MAKFTPQIQSWILASEGGYVDDARDPGGATIPEVPCEWIVGPVARQNGEVHLTLILPHGPNPSEAVAFPEPVSVTQDGPITIPHDEEPADVDA